MNVKPDGQQATVSYYFSNIADYKIFMTAHYPHTQASLGGGDLIAPHFSKQNQLL